jgi:hypothetical protein
VKLEYIQKAVYGTDNGFITGLWFFSDLTKRFTFQGFYPMILQEGAEMKPPLFFCSL